MKPSIVKVNQRPQYIGLRWEKVIRSPESPNFWKFGVANLVFLEQVGNKKFVVDLGCGTGGSTLFLASKGKSRLIVGVDLLRDMIKVAKKKAADAGLDNKMSFIVCDGRHLPLKTSLFDGLVSRGDAFCFLVPLKAAVQELKRIMKPGGVIVLEMDNRVDWKPGTIISTGFQKTNDGKIAYIITRFTKKRNYTSISYILDPNSRIAKNIAGDAEFQKKGFKPSKYPYQEVKRETVDMRRAAPTHWPLSKELTRLIRKGGFTDVQLIGDGLLMELFLDGDPKIVQALKRNPELFFEIEKRLVPYMNPAKAPTMILRASAARAA